MLNQNVNNKLNIVTNTTHCSEARNLIGGFSLSSWISCGTYISSYKYQVCSTCDSSNWLVRLRIYYVFFSLYSWILMGQVLLQELNNKLKYLWSVTSASHSFFRSHRRMALGLRSIGCWRKIIRSRLTPFFELYKKPRFTVCWTRLFLLAWSRIVACNICKHQQQKIRCAPYHHATTKGMQISYLIVLTVFTACLYTISELIQR